MEGGGRWPHFRGEHVLQGGGGREGGRERREGGREGGEGGGEEEELSNPTTLRSVLISEVASFQG